MTQNNYLLHAWAEWNSPLVSALRNERELKVWKIYPRVKSKEKANPKLGNICTIYIFAKTWVAIACQKNWLNPILSLSSVQSLSRVRLFATPWIAACQASLFITISQSSLRLMSIESVMPSSHLILLSPSPPAFNLSQHQGLFKWVSSSHQVAKVLEFQLQHHSFHWIPRTDLL